MLGIIVPTIQSSSGDSRGVPLGTPTIPTTTITGLFPTAKIIPSIRGTTMTQVSNLEDHKET